MFGAACLVMFFIQALREPEMAERIDRLFAPDVLAEAGAAPSRELTPAQRDELIIGPATTEATFAGNTLVATPDNASAKRFDLSAVRDNTYFRPEENAAWFAVWEWLQMASPQDLEPTIKGDVSYAQFIEQPEVYRGELVNVRGVVHREELLDAPANDVGIKQYHRLILRPKGGGVWPIVVYCWELPESFPRGDVVRADVEVSGVFFKNWSYSWDEGLGLAPVVLARALHWQPATVVQPARTEVSLVGVLSVVAGAALIAAIVGWFAWRQTRRPATSVGSSRVLIAPPVESVEGPP
jgi:hypothetical protein